MTAAEFFQKKELAQLVGPRHRVVQPDGQRRDFGKVRGMLSYIDKSLRRVYHARRRPDCKRDVPSGASSRILPGAPSAHKT